MIGRAAVPCPPPPLQGSRKLVWWQEAPQSFAEHPSPPRNPDGGARSSRGQMGKDQRAPSVRGLAMGLDLTSVKYRGTSLLSVAKRNSTKCRVTENAKILHT